MANFITAPTAWNGKETLEYFFKPLLIGKNPLEMQGIKVFPNVVTNQKLNYFSRNGKVTKAYSKGFTGTQTDSLTQRTLTVHKLKAEKGQDANEFADTVFQILLGKGILWNNLDEAGELKNIIMQIFTDDVLADIFRIFWLADTNKETISSGKYTGSADTNYNMFDGMLKTLRDNSATSPSATQIQKIAMSHGAVAQVETVEATTGSSGNLIITLAGVDYTTAYATSLTATVTAFVAAHASDIADRGITLTDSGSAVMVFTSTRAGMPFTAPVFAATSDITGTVTHTTANTAPAALSADETIGYLRQLYEGCSDEMAAMPDNEKVYLVDRASYDNYQESLENSGATDGGRVQIMDGVTGLKYRGSFVINCGWNHFLNADFPTGYPNHIVYTTLDNLIMGIDALSEFSTMEFWYNKDEQENRFRIQYKMGADFTHYKMSAIAF